jgi:hypothetical protein
MGYVTKRLAAITQPLVWTRSLVTQSAQFGLIAEEVREVNPDLTTRDTDGIVRGKNIITGVALVEVYRLQ